MCITCRVSFALLPPGCVSSFFLPCKSANFLCRGDLWGVWIEGEVHAWCGIDFSAWALLLLLCTFTAASYIAGLGLLEPLLPAASGGRREEGEEAVCGPVDLLRFDHI